MLYYSPDDVHKFKFLIRKQSSCGNADKKKSAEVNLERKLSQLEDMNKYCIDLKCRRNTLVGHFGGKPVDCGKTCDYCSDPKKVEKALRSAKAIRDVRTQSRGKCQQQQWDGQWDGPHEELLCDNDWGGKGLVVGDLRITGPLEVDPRTSGFETKKVGPKAGFVKASDILSKYEAMEGKAYRNGSFFAPSDATPNTKRTYVNIPEHLIASLNAASTKAMMKKPFEKKSVKALSSKDHANSVSGIEKQLAKLKSEREARLKALQERKKNGYSSNTPPPPPPLSFGRKK